MPNTSASYLAICPFFMGEAVQSITCEGIVDGTVSVTRFCGERQKKEFQAQHCQRYTCFATCPLAAVIIKKYDDQGREWPWKAKKRKTDGETSTSKNQSTTEW